MKRSFCVILTIVLVLSVFASFAPHAYAAAQPQKRIETRVIPADGTETDQADKENLFAGYVDQVFASYAPKAEEPTRGSIHTDLDGAVNNALYNAIKTQIERIAAGEVSSTEFTISASSVGIDSSIAYTAADLGVTSIFDDEGYLSIEAATALQKKAGFDLDRIFMALMNNCPYDLYWFDKTYGYGYSMYWITGDGSAIGITDTLWFSFVVAEEYRADDDYYTVDPSTGQTVQRAAAKAASIVEKNKNLPDYDKLVAYKDAICDLTSYN